MFRKTIILTTLAATLATTLIAGSAFASQVVVGQVTRTDAASGYVWLDNGVKYSVGQDVAASVLPGDKLSVRFDSHNGAIDVLSADPIS